jgi:pimeloyl-ACP methyl ester carboxylesterase
MGAPLTIENKKLRVLGEAGSLYVEDGGSGNIPVVFIHSFAGSIQHWRSQLEHLREHRRAIAFDWRGHGNSDPSLTNDYSVEAVANDIAAVVDKLDLERFVLIGHSMGGSAAIGYVDNHVSRVAGLVVLATPGRSPAEIAEPVMNSLRSSAYQKVMDDYVGQLLTNALPDVQQMVNEGAKRLSKDASTEMVNALFEFDPVDKLKKFPGPKLIVSVAHEDQQPNSLHNQLPDVSSEVVAGTSHWLHLDRPDQFNTIIDEFLKKIDEKELK